MEVRNKALFIVSTFLLVAAMTGIIFLFSRHPMGADFTTYKLINVKQLREPVLLRGERVAVRGEVSVNDPEKLLTLGENKNVIGYIKKRIDRTQPEGAPPMYEDFRTLNFRINVNGVLLPVRGQPEQVEEVVGRLKAAEDPDLYWDLIQAGKEYSIFGTIRITPTGEAYLVPYRVTSAPISRVQQEAARINKKVNFTQYLSVFAVVAIYIAVLWLGKVFGPPEEETEEDEEIEKNE